MSSSWLAEIRRRNVHRVLLAYLAGSWLIAQVTELLSDAFGWPAWALRATVVLLLAGLPAALIVAWLFELTPTGLVRETEPRTGSSLRLRSHRAVDLVIAALLVAALGYFVATHDWARPEARPPAAGTAPRLAVLPFKPLLAASRDEALELGMADTLITRLSGIKGVIVSPLSSVRRYGALDQDPLAAGRELDVSAVLDGSVQRSGQRLRVTARLLAVADGRQLWSAQFDQRYTDIFSVQDSIADRVTGALAPQLTPAEHDRLPRRPTNEPRYGTRCGSTRSWTRSAPTLGTPRPNGASGCPPTEQPLDPSHSECSSTCRRTGVPSPRSRSRHGNHGIGPPAREPPARAIDS